VIVLLTGSPGQQSIKVEDATCTVLFVQAL